MFLIIVLDSERDFLIFLDAKKGDIDSTNRGYLKYAFEYLRVDAITLYLYLDVEFLEEFLSYSREKN